MAATDIDSVLDRAVFSRDGLMPAIIQQWDTREVLMLGYMNAEALRRTLTEGRVTFWSRSRSEFWRKGDTSGHVQWVRSAALDCDSDTILVAVDQIGAACHTGAHACFDVDPLDPAVTPREAGAVSPHDGGPVTPRGEDPAAAHGEWDGSDG